MGAMGRVDDRYETDAATTHFLVSPVGWTDLVVDLRSAEVQEAHPLPAAWEPTVVYESQAPGWSLTGMHVPFPVKGTA